MRLTCAPKEENEFSAPICTQSGARAHLRSSALISRLGQAPERTRMHQNRSEGLARESSFCIRSRDLRAFFQVRARSLVLGRERERDLLAPRLLQRVAKWTKERKRLKRRRRRRDERFHLSSAQSVSLSRPQSRLSLPAGAKFSGRKLSHATSGRNKCVRRASASQRAKNGLVAEQSAAKRMYNLITLLQS